jgi:hypothetical protein
MSCGGNTFLTIQALSPLFHDSFGARMTGQWNPYSLAILDRVKTGGVVYVGQSAGTVALSYAVGPLTEDDSFPELESQEVVNIDHGLGLEWLLPRIGEYLGIPYRLTFRPHLRFEIDSVAYDINVLGADRAAQALGGGVEHDVYGVIMADYDFHNGKGDAVEISGGKIQYHVGYTDEVKELTSSAATSLSRFKFYWKYGSQHMPMQPLGNPEQGWTFEWVPAHGDVFAAGPKASRPFHLYTSTLGPFADAPPVKTPAPQPRPPTGNQTEVVL